MTKKALLIVLIALCTPIFGWALFSKNTSSTEIVMFSTSSDGHYVISVDVTHNAVLWDLQKKSKTLISTHANLYSPYWIKGTSDFMWQDDNQIVHIQNTDNEIIKNIPLNFVVYGEAISTDFKNYIVSDINYNVFLYQDGVPYQLAWNYSSATFDGANKVINFTFLDNDMVLASGLAMADAKVGPTLWDLKSHKTKYNYIGNIAKTFANLSPDGKYIIAGDENTRGFVWEAQSGKKVFELWDIWYGQPIEYDKYHHVTKTDSAGLIPVPDNFAQENGFQSSAILSMKFIDATHYLRFTTYIPYAILYDIHDPKPIKYFFLGKHPMPSVSYYERDQAIDTSPSAHILVMGKDTKPGILVYQYDPNKQTLTKIWDAD